MNNNIFKFCNKKSDQFSFLAWIINYCNTTSKYKEVGRRFIKLLADKTENNEFKEYIIKNDYKVEIITQLKNLNLVLKINNFYIIIEDEIDTIEYDDQIDKYKYTLLNSKIIKPGYFHIFTCYYKIDNRIEEDDNIFYSIITMKDMLQFLETIEDRNLYMEDYYQYLKEVIKGEEK